MEEVGLVSQTEIISETTKIILDTIWNLFEKEGSNVISTLKDDDNNSVLLSIKFSRILNEMKLHAKHSSNFLIKKLIDWRHQRLLGGNITIDIDSNNDNNSKSCYLICVSIIYVRTILIIVNNNNISNELINILVNQGFECFLNTTSLQRKKTMIQWTFNKMFQPKNFKYTTPFDGNNINSPIFAKKVLLFNLWSTLIGILSKIQNGLEIIINKFKECYDINNTSNNTILFEKENKFNNINNINIIGNNNKNIDTIHTQSRLIRGIRSIKLNLNNPNNIEKSCELITYLLNIFNNHKKSDIKRSIAETITLILYPLSEVNIKNISIKISDKWWKVIYNVYINAENWCKKKKRYPLGLPLMMSALCCMEKESFLSHRLMCCNKLYSFVKENNMLNRSIGLACLRKILETYLKHFADGKTGTHVHLQNLNHQILFELKWDDKGEHQDGITAYVLTLFEKKSEYALANILLCCLENGIINTHALAGLRALNVILYGASSDVLNDNDNSVNDKDYMNHFQDTMNKTNNDESSDEVDLKKASDYIIETTYGPKMSSVLKTLIKRIKPISGSLLAKIKKSTDLSKLLIQILHETKSVMLRHGSNSHDKGIEIKPSDKRNLAMFRLCVLCLPRLHIWKHNNDNNSNNNSENGNDDIMKTSDLIYLLGMSSISQHDRIASAAQHVLTYLMMYHKDLRSSILEDLSIYLLQQHGNNVKNINILLNMLKAFISIWLSEIVNTNERTCFKLTKLNISKIEASGIFWLTSTSHTVRISSLKLIELCCELGKYQPKLLLHKSEEYLLEKDQINNINNYSDLSSSPSSRLPDVRIHEIIKLTDNDLKMKHEYALIHKQPSSTIYYTNNNINKTNISVNILAKGQDPEQQLQWSMCLASILQKSVNKRCKSLLYAYDQGKIHVDDALKYIRNNDKSMIQKMNMIGIWTNFVLFCSICVAMKNDNANAEEYFNSIIPLLSNEAINIQFMGALSLGKIDPSMILTLMKCLESIQHSVFSMKKKPKNYLKLLNNLTHIYRFLAEDLESNTILQSETIRERMMNFVEKMMKFMEEYRANIRPDCLILRIHFCVVVKNLLEKWPEYNNTNNIDPISCKLRRKLFDFMISWCGSHKKYIISNNVNNDNMNKKANKNEDNMSEIESVALSAIVSLLKGPTFETQDILNDNITGNHYELRNGVVFKWIRTVLLSQNNEIVTMGSLALSSFLKWNYEQIQDFIEECYNKNHTISKKFFIVLSHVWLMDRFHIPKHILFHLCIYKMGDISMKVRSAALKIGREIPSLIPCENDTINMQLNFIISSRLPDSYIESQFKLSLSLSKSYPSLSTKIIHEFGVRLKSAHLTYVGVMLQYICPWLKNIKLKSFDNNATHLIIESKYNENINDEDHDVNNHFILDILFEVTIKYGTQYSNGICNVWMSLTHNKCNIPIILNYLLNKCCNDFKYEKWIQIEASKRIALYCARASRVDTIQYLIDIINTGDFENITNNNNNNHSQLLKVQHDPQTALSTPAPPTLLNKDTIYFKKDKKIMSPIQSPILTREQIQLVQNIENSPINDDNNKYNYRLNTNRVKQIIHPNDNNNISVNDLNLDEIPSILYQIQKCDYGLMLLVELAYEMDLNDIHFMQNLALMLHVGILGLDHPFKSLSEHCKRLLMNLIHSIHFRDISTDDNVEDHAPEAQELMNYLVSKRNQSMWDREIINDKNIYNLKSSKYLSFLVQWLITVITKKQKCIDIPKIWSKSTINWMQQTKSPLIACRSLQIYRSLQRFLNDDKFDVNVFDNFIEILKDELKSQLWCDMLVIMRDWVGCLVLKNNIDNTIWIKMFWSAAVICHKETFNRPHIYVHGLSLLANILKELGFDEFGKLWDIILKNVPTNHIKQFKGIQPIITKGLIFESTKMQSEQFLAGLMLLNYHPIISSHNEQTRLHLTFVSILPSICLHLQTMNANNNQNDILSKDHLITICKYVSTCFKSLKENDSNDNVIYTFDQLSSIFANIEEYSDVKQFLGDIIIGVSKWINMSASSDYHCTKLLLNLLSKSNDIMYQKQILYCLHGILCNISWINSDLKMVEPSFFDKINELLHHDILWKEAILITEIIVKVNNDSSKSVSLLYPPILHPNNMNQSINNSQLKAITYNNISPSRIKNPMVSLELNDEYTDNLDNISRSHHELLCDNMDEYSQGNYESKNLKHNKNFEPNRANKELPPPFSSPNIHINTHKSNKKNANKIKTLTPPNKNVINKKVWKEVIKESQNDSCFSPKPIKFNRNNIESPKNVNN